MTTLPLEIIRASEFIRMNPQRKLDLAASKAALAGIARACRKRGIDQAMLDLRAVQPGPKPVFTQADLAELVGSFRDIGFTQRHRLAILYHSDPHRRARLFAFLGTKQGWAVKAFGEFEKALLWLSSARESESSSERSAGALQIPVRFPRMGTKVPLRKASPRRQPGRKSGTRTNRNSATRPRKA
jgi:hypothetical protein